MSGRLSSVSTRFLMEEKSFHSLVRSEIHYFEHRRTGKVWGVKVK
jgi:hypothetical protein